MGKSKLGLTILVCGALLGGISGANTVEKVYAEEYFTHSESLAKANGSPSLAFQIRVIPILEDLFASRRYTRFLGRHTDYYFDNDNLKVIFITKRGHKSSITELRQVLEQRLKSEVGFAASDYSGPDLARLEKEVNEYIREIYTGAYSVSYAINSPKIEIVSQLTDSQNRFAEPIRRNSS